MAFSSASATPFGMRPVRYKNGAPWTGAGNWYFAADATRIGMFEPVASTGAAHAVTGQKQVTRYTAAAGILGVAVGFLPGNAMNPMGTQANLAAPTSGFNYDYRVASIDAWVLVVDDPNVIFEIQEDGDTTPVVVASIGLNADLITAADCSTVTGLSVAALDSNTVSATATLDLKIVGLSTRLDGSNPVDTTYNMFDVMINVHELGQGLGSLGI